jgi:hypothetical protein
MLSEIATAPNGELSENPVVQRLLDELRDEFWVLRVDQPNVENPKTGERIAPAALPLCPGCGRDLGPGKTLFYGVVNDDAHFCCDGCFDDSWQPYVEEKLAAGGDY